MKNLLAGSLTGQQFFQMSYILPVEIDRLIIGVSETYDVKVIIPTDSSYEFLATSEDRTGSTSLWLGAGVVKKAEPLPRLKYFEA